MSDATCRTANSRVGNWTLIAELDRWPEAWKGLDSDVPVGVALVGAMRPFLESLIASGLARSTLRRHCNHLGLLGGEIISRLQHEPEMRHLSGVQLLLEHVDPEGGPLSRHLHTEGEQRSFDGTCRKLHRFLTAEAAGGDSRRGTLTAGAAQPRKAKRR